MAIGYPFEVRSNSVNPAQAKAAIRSKWKNWFEIADGPRGWIVGPLICLWLDVGLQGPSLLAWISADGFGTRIRGRVGQSLFHVVAAMALLAAATVLTLVTGHSNPANLLLAGFCAAIFGFAAWSARWFRHDSDPLVRFLRSTVGVEISEPRRLVTNPKGPFLPMSLVVNGDVVASQATPNEICHEIDVIEQEASNGFLILGQDEQHYMQTAFEFAGFLLEKRDGGAKSHFRAVREFAVPSDSSPCHFSSDDVTQALLDYLEGRSNTSGIRWKPI